MRPCSPATAALLANPPPGLRSADLFTFTLRDGVTVYPWTSYDRDLLVNGDVYSSRKPWLQRSRWNVANTMQVPTLEVRLLALNDAFSGGADIKAQLTNGLFDGASATFDRAWFPPGTTVIDDLVEYISGSSFTTVTTVNLDSISNASTTETGGLTAGVTLSGFSTTDVVRISQPGGGTYTAINPRFDLGWDNRVDIIPDGIPGNSFFVNETGTGASHLANHSHFGTAAAAQAAFGAHQFTGAASYTFYYLDSPTTDNSGGLSILVESASPTVGTYAGIRLAGGNVADIEIVGNMATINIKGKVNLLDQYAPRNLYQLGCEHAFCDAGCTLARASFTSSYTVGAGPTRILVPWSGSAPSNPGRYRFGTVAFTSGACAGQQRTVRAADSTGLTLIHPLVGTPAAGDAFTAFEGCDKALSSGSGQDCTARSNTQNWRAFPYVPPADSAF